MISKEELHEIVESTLKHAITNFFMDRKVRVEQPLDKIFPAERRIRSLIGGLETSMGTTVWEPIAVAIAKKNDFQELNTRDFLMVELPRDIITINTKWRDAREHGDGNIVLDNYILEVRNAANMVDVANLGLSRPTAGKGVDLWLKKDGTEYIFDIKTTQWNSGSGIAHNATLMNWYAWRLVRDPYIGFEARYALPFNPYTGMNWWDKNGSRARPLVRGQDLWVEDEFWDFLSGIKGTYSHILKVFTELGGTRFGDQFHDIFYGNSS